MSDAAIKISEEDYEKIKMFFRNNFRNRIMAVNCIFHYDTTKSLKVGGDRYNCLGCNKNGTTASLINKLKVVFGDY